MMIGAVHERHPGGGMAEMLAEVSPPKPAPSTTMWNCLLSGTGTMLMNPGRNQWNNPQKDGASCGIMSRRRLSREERQSFVAGATQHSQTRSGW